jgi:sugar phosphate isomerase/epimerase
MKLDFYIETPESPSWKDRRSFERILQTIAESGYDGVEFLPFHIKSVDIKYLKDQISSYKLEIVCVASGFLNTYYGLSISHPSDRIRRLAVENLKECIKFASDLGSKFVSIGLIKGKLLIGQSYDNAIKNFSESLTECSNFAKDNSISLVVEPENRYESNILCTVEECVKVLDNLNLSNVGLLIDSYHMNIEEANIHEAVKISSKRLLHVHLADNNRLAPGKGFFDFLSFLKYLKEIKYNSFLGIEINPLPSLDIVIKDCAQQIKKIINKL